DLTVADVDADLDELEPLLMRYEVDGKRYLAVRSWHEFQHPQRPSKSKLPSPDEGIPRVIAEPSASPPRGVADGVEWSGSEVGEGERIADESANDDAIGEPICVAFLQSDLHARVHAHFRPRMGNRYNEDEVDQALATVRARGYDDTAIADALRT